MASTTITLSGNSSSLSAYFHPEIELDEHSNYSCSLLDFTTYNSVPNVHEGNNKFYYSLINEVQIDCIEIPVGSYELDDIIKLLNDHFKAKKIYFEMTGNKCTMKCYINCDPKLVIDFRDEADSIGSLLGFDRRVLSDEKWYKSDHPIQIQHINTIRINCDLTSGSFHNGKSTHTIYEFSPSVSPGYKIIEQPRNLIYLPIVRRRINIVNVTIVDQDNKLVDFRGENISCRIHIKKDI